MEHFHRAVPGLAKEARREAPIVVSTEDLENRKLRKPEEASRRALIICWSEYPPWIKLHDPLSDEWHGVRAEECLLGVMKTADKHLEKGKRSV